MDVELVYKTEEDFNSAVLRICAEEELEASKFLPEQLYGSYLFFQKVCLKPLEVEYDSNIKALVLVPG